MNGNMRLTVQLPAVAGRFYQRLSQTLRISLEEALEIGLSSYAFDASRELERNSEVVVHRYVLKTKSPGRS